MTPFAVLNKDVGPEHLKLLADVIDFVDALPDDRVWTCHEVCAAAAARWPGELECATGHFAFRGAEHSWLVLRKAPDLVLDAYPWGGVAPFLVCTIGHLNPWRRLYLPDGYVAAKVAARAASR